MPLEWTLGHVFSSKLSGESFITRDDMSITSEMHEMGKTYIFPSCGAANFKSENADEGLERWASS